MSYPMILKFLQEPLMKDMLKGVLEDHLAFIEWITIVRMFSYLFQRHFRDSGFLYESYADSSPFYHTYP